MKKLLLATLLFVSSVIIFASATTSVYAYVSSPSIDMMNPVTLTNGGDIYTITGIYSYDDSYPVSQIEMDTYYTFVKILIHYKSNSVNLNYYLEVYFNSTWVEVASTSSSASSGSIDIFTQIYDGEIYRVRVENPWVLFGRSSTIDLEWYALR